MSLYQAPPEALEIDGIWYPVDTDFRVWMEFQSILTEKSDDEEKAGRLCDLMERLGLPLATETLEAMLTFYGAASTERGVGQSRPAAFDFDVDSEAIYAAFWGTYHMDLTEERIHWWRFKALFKSLPEDCELCKIMRYRTIDLKDVPKSQKSFYREMKARYALHGSGQTYRTEQDMRDYVKRRYEETQARLSALRGGEQSGDAGQTGESV